MAGKRVAYESVPFFWTTQAGLYFRYVGHAEQWDEIIIRGDVSAQDFVAFYVKNGRVRAAAGNNREKEMGAIEELMRMNKMPSPDEVR
ncbi:MAG: oxidoreductase C-terminal domain-containing protein [Deltaproteobacteria bacterium]